MPRPARHPKTDGGWRRNVLLPRLDLKEDLTNASEISGSHTFKIFQKQTLKWQMFKLAAVSSYHIVYFLTQKSKNNNRQITFTDYCKWIKNLCVNKWRNPLSITGIDKALSSALSYLFRPSQCPILPHVLIQYASLLHFRLHFFLIWQNRKKKKKNRNNTNV